MDEMEFDTKAITEKSVLLNILFFCVWKDLSNCANPVLANWVEEFLKRQHS